MLRQGEKLGCEVMHRDIKAGNVCARLVDGQWLAVLMDFGGMYRKDKEDYHSLISHSVRTVRYSAASAV
jgi:hypothetical protein